MHLASTHKVLGEKRNFEIYQRLRWTFPKRSHIPTKLGKSLNFFGFANNKRLQQTKIKFCYSLIILLEVDQSTKVSSFSWRLLLALHGNQGVQWQSELVLVA